MKRCDRSIQAVPGGNPPRHYAVQSAVRRSRTLAALWRPEPGAWGPRSRAFYAPSTQGHQQVTERLEKGGRKGDSAKGKGGGGPGGEREAAGNGLRGGRAWAPAARRGWLPRGRSARQPCTPRGPPNARLPGAHSPFPRRVCRLLPPRRRPPPPPSPRCPSSVPPPAPSCERRSGHRRLHRPGWEPPLRPLAWARSESGARRPPGSSVRFNAGPGSPGRRPRCPARLAGSTASHRWNLGRTPTGLARGAIPEPRGYAQRPPP